MLQVGAAVGALTVAPFLSSRWGRRETMFAGAAVTASGIAPCTFLSAYIPFTAAWTVAGDGVGLMTVALPMYICEVAPTRIRGILGSMMQLACQSGLLLAALMGIFFFPMSPRLALPKFKRKQPPNEGVQRAKTSLRRLRGNEVEAGKELEAKIVVLEDKFKDLEKSVHPFHCSPDSGWSRSWFDDSGLANVHL